MRSASSRSTILPWTIALLAAAGLAVIAARVPISEGDDAFYASIARHPPDVYVRFYGPVFFQLLGLSFSLFGLSISALRLISLAGAALILLACDQLAHTFGAGARDRAWVCVILLLSPEVGWAATSGRMDALAVGLGLMGLAFLIAGLKACATRDAGATSDAGTTLAIVGQAFRPALFKAQAFRPACAGIFFAAAALTTPRMFPFMLGAAVAGIVTLATGDRESRRHLLCVLVAPGAVTLTVVLLWLELGAGGIGAWTRMMWSVATQQRDDVAILGGVRVLSFAWTRVLTPVAAIAGGSALIRSGGAGLPHFPLRFALLTAWVTLIVSASLFTMTFFFATYVIVPLFVVVLAASASRLPRRAAAAGAIALLLEFGAMRIGKHVRAAVTWSARDAGRVEAFVAAHVPPGSVVTGPHYLYFFPVERSGSRFRSASAENWADWTQWIDAAPPPEPTVPNVPAFMLWPNDRDLIFGTPPAGACARSKAIAAYEPPPDDLPLLSKWTANDDLREYPRATLYRCGI